MTKTTKTNNLLAARLAGEFSLVSEFNIDRFKAGIDSLQTHPKAEIFSAAVPSTSNDFWYAPDDWRSEYRPYIVKDGILQIPVKGSLLNEFPFQVGSWVTGYEYIWEAYIRGLNDSDVKGIALVIDSPGGLVAGCFSLVDKMYQLKGSKPIKSFASESAYSAAYAIASLGDTITVSRTGGVGSIGVIMTHYDYSGALQQAGIKVTNITAGKHKADGSSSEPLPQDVYDRLSARAESIRDIFVETVSRNRPALTQDQARATEALCYNAQEAIQEKLADDIGDLDESLASFSLDVIENTNTDDDNGEYELNMKTQDNGVNVDEIKAEAHAAGFAEGAKAEQARFSAILSAPEAAGRSKLAMHLASNTAMSVDDVVSTLKVAAPEVAPQVVAQEPEAGAITFEKAMSAENPEITPEGKSATPDTKDAALASILDALPNFK